MAAFTQLDCLDFAQFKDTLKRMRLVDDTIIYALNTKLPTESFNASQNCQDTCKDLYKQLEDSYKIRENAFNQCLEYSRGKVKELKNLRTQDGSNIGAIKELRKEQSKVRLLETELGVEEIIQARTKKVYYERCRPHFVPEDFNI